MRVVAGGAGGLVVDDVFPVKFEALIRKNALATVAFVTQRIARRRLCAEISQDELAFQQGRIRGSMGAVRAASTGARTLVVVMAIGAVHETRWRPWGNQAWHIGILAGTHYWMKRLVGWTEFEPRVRLR